jgi:GDP-L-fucose synthase
MQEPHEVDWTKTRVMLTGGAGFLGSFVRGKLRQRGLPEENLFVPRLADCDLTSQDNVRAAYDRATPDIVIHLAAEVGGIGANRDNPGRFFYANMAMGLHLIEEARLRGLKKFVQIGTICAYPKFTPVPFKEADLWNGYPEETNAPYGIAKKALLVMCQAYRQQYGLNAVFLLPVNLYGPGDNFDLGTSHVIPAMIRKCVEARERGDDRIICWGDGSPTREFLYVEDAAEAIVLATERYDGQEPVNLGTGREISMKELAALIVQESGFKGRLEWDVSKPNGQPRRCVSTDRAERLFGFKAGTPFEEGLRRTIEWYESHIRQSSTGNTLR